MKKYLIPCSLAALLLSGFAVQSCKNKANNTHTETNTTAPTGTTTDTANTAPVTVSGDEDLRKGVEDATKDYPGVTATVNNGEVTLNGSIERSRLPKLMQSIHSLNPKKVNNNLTVK